MEFIDSDNLQLDNTSNSTSTWKVVQFRNKKKNRDTRIPSHYSNNRYTNNRNVNRRNNRLQYFSNNRDSNKYNNRYNKKNANNYSGYKGNSKYNNRPTKQSNYRKKQIVDLDEIQVKLEKVLTGNMRALRLEEWRAAFKNKLIKPDTIIEKISKKDGAKETWSVLQMLGWYLMHQELKCCLDEVCPQTTGLAEDGDLLALIEKREKILGTFNENTAKEIKATKRVIESFNFPRRISIEINRETPDKIKIKKIILDEKTPEYALELIIDRVSKGIIGLKNNSFSHKYHDKYATFMISVNEVFQEMDENKRPLRKFVIKMVDYFLNAPITKLVEKEQIPQIISRFFGRLIGKLKSNNDLIIPVIEFILDNHTQKLIKGVQVKDNSLILSSIIFLKVLPDIYLDFSLEEEIVDKIFIPVKDLFLELLKLAINVEKFNDDNSLIRYKYIIIDNFLKNCDKKWFNNFCLKNIASFDKKEEILFFIDAWSGNSLLSDNHIKWLQKAKETQERLRKPIIIPENAIDSIDKLKEIDSLDILSPDIEDYDKWDLIETYVSELLWHKAELNIDELLPGEKWRLVLISIIIFVNNNNEKPLNNLIKLKLFLKYKKMVLFAIEKCKMEILADIEQSSKLEKWKEVKRFMYKWK